MQIQASHLLSSSLARPEVLSLFCSSSYHLSQEGNGPHQTFGERPQDMDSAMNENYVVSPVFSVIGNNI